MYPYKPTPDENDTRQYVEFYRFWAWEYTARNPDFVEIVNVVKEAEAYFQGIGIDNFSMAARGLTDPDSIVAFEMHVGREFTIEERQLFKKALFAMMRARLHFGFEINGPYQEKGITSDQILKLLENGEELFRPKSPRERSEGARLVRQCEFQNGFKVLYDGPYPIFGYDALVAIDFDRPISEIQFQIENVKKEFEIYREIERGGNSFFTDFQTVEFEKIGIQKNPNIQFKIGTDNPRAIGIWLWDYIQRSGDPTRRGIKIEAIRELKKTFDVAKLGYAETDSRTFQNYLDSTIKCIEAAEVLAMH